MSSLGSSGKNKIISVTIEALRECTGNGGYFSKTGMAKIAKAAKESGLNAIEAENIISETIFNFQKSKIA
jgi:hypothetical protein